MEKPDRETYPSTASSATPAACAPDCACREKARASQRGYVRRHLATLLHRSARVWIRGIISGLLTGVLATVIMIPLEKTGASPLPAPLGLAFADTILHRHLPLPVGLAFHLAYVAFWGTAFVLFAYPRLTAIRVAALSAGLYVFALVVFVPLVGWGVFGAAVGPRVAAGLAITHALFGFFLWLFSKVIFRRDVDNVHLHRPGFP